MEKFLVSFTYHTARDWALSEITRQPLEPTTTSLFVQAASAREALAWVEDVAMRVMASLNRGDDKSWRDWNHRCWIETDPVAAGLIGDLSFVQTIRVGETPVFERMTVEAYLDWLELYGVVDELQD